MPGIARCSTVEYTAVEEETSPQVPPEHPWGPSHAILSIFILHAGREVWVEADSYRSIDVHVLRHTKEATSEGIRT